MFNRHSAYVDMFSRLSFIQFRLCSGHWSLVTVFLSRFKKKKNHWFATYWLGFTLLWSLDNVLVLFTVAQNEYPILPPTHLCFDLVFVFFCFYLGNSCRQTWLIDGSIIATKIKNASGTEPESCDLSRENRLQSNPTRDCPRCSYIIDNNNVCVLFLKMIHWLVWLSLIDEPSSICFQQVSQKWPGLPKGVRFDPTDSELLLHLLAKSGKCGANPHPFINEFITTIEECDGICYTHPQRLPGKNTHTISL